MTGTGPGEEDRSRTGTVAIAWLGSVAVAWPGDGFTTISIYYTIKVMKSLFPKKTVRIALLVPLLMLLPLAGLFAEEGGWLYTPHYERDGVTMFAEATAVANTGQGWETYYVAFQPYFQMDTTRITAFTGMQLTGGTFDLSAGATYWPWVWNVAKVGFSVRYNLNYYNDISLIHNILLGASMEARPFKWFGMKASVSGLIKNRSIFVIDSSRKYLHNFCQAFSVEADVYLPYDIMAYFSVASYERYRYMMAVAPSFTLGGTKQLVNNFYAGLEVAVRYTDFFTASTFYDGCEIRIMAGRSF